MYSLIIIQHVYLKEHNQFIYATGLYVLMLIFLSRELVLISFQEVHGYFRLGKTITTGKIKSMQNAKSYSNLLITYRYNNLI